MIEQRDFIFYKIENNSNFDDNQERLFAPTKLLHNNVALNDKNQ